MDWQAIGTIIALVGVIVTFLLTMKGQHQDRQIAEHSARRAEAAGRLTADYAERVVSALEWIASTSTSGPGVAVPPRVTWSLRSFGGDAYILENSGTATADDVQISTDESLSLMNVAGGPSVAPGEAVTFVAAPSLATSDLTVTVTWGGGDHEGVWRYPLPYRT